LSAGTLDIVREERVATLVINRPEKRNALSPEILRQIHATLTKWAGGDDIRAVVIRGAGEVAFSAGFDLGALPSEGNRGTDQRPREPHLLEKALKSILTYPYPVIAFLNGYAFGGGCELALCCDLRIGVEGLRMGMPPAKLGLVYSAAGLARFISTVGLARTKEIFFTGRYFSDLRAKEMGLVDYLLPRPEAEAFVRETALEIAGNAPLSLKGTKKILNMLSRAPSLSEEDRKEADRLVAASLRSEDFREAQKAFLEKRKPDFKGK